MEALRIIFMGTPDFAVGILDVLVKNEYNIVGVITAPDRPAGRGRKLNESAWYGNMPKYGTFNLHASLLPDYRGAAPINWAIINGETKTGVTTFFIDEKIDTGAIILQDETSMKMPIMQKIFMTV
ncbi:unnamed protein product [Bathycoccus prasinos]